MKPFQILRKSISNPPRKSDERTQNRIPARYYAYIHAATGAVLSECLVKEISEAGARIILPMAADLPKKIMLRVTGEATPMSASVIWQTDSKCGLEFNDAGFG
jgi:hypothetical protein